jgi:hypothetical protein
MGGVAHETERKRLRRLLAQWQENLPGRPSDQGIALAAMRRIEEALENLAEAVEHRGEKVPGSRCSLVGTCRKRIGPRRPDADVCRWPSPLRSPRDGAEPFESPTAEA